MRKIVIFSLIVIISGVALYIFSPDSEEVQPVQFELKRIPEIRYSKLLVSIEASTWLNEVATGDTEESPSAYESPINNEVGQVVILDSQGMNNDSFSGSTQKQKPNSSGEKTESEPKPTAPNTVIETKPKPNVGKAPPVKNAATSIDASLIEKAKWSTFTLYTDKQQGSGTLINNIGFVITNAHVVAESLYITVKDSQGVQYDGVLVGKSVSEDLALIFVKELVGREPLGLLNTEVEKGEEVFTVGSPTGKENTITIGRVTQTGINIVTNYTYNRLYEIDAELGLGSSGGPLISVKNKKIIGINSMVAIESKKIGFSIPSSTLLPIVNNWISEYEATQNEKSKEELRVNLLTTFVEELLWELENYLTTEDYSGIESLIGKDNEFYNQLISEINTQTRIVRNEDHDQTLTKVDAFSYKTQREILGTFVNENNETITTSYKIELKFQFKEDSLVIPVEGNFSKIIR